MPIDSNPHPIELFRQHLLRDVAALQWPEKAGPLAAMAVSRELLDLSDPTFQQVYRAFESGWIMRSDVVAIIRQGVLELLAGELD